MKLRIRFRRIGTNGGGRRPVTLTVSVPGRHIILAARSNGRRFLWHVSKEFIAAFETRHRAEVLQIRQPYRRA